MQNEKRKDDKLGQIVVMGLCCWPRDRSCVDGKSPAKQNKIKESKQQIQHKRKATSTSFNQKRLIEIYAIACFLSDNVKPQNCVILIHSTSGGSEKKTAANQTQTDTIKIGRFVKLQKCRR